VKLERAKIVVRCTHDNLRAARDAWVKMLADTPMHALNWSNDGVRSIVACDVYEQAMKVLEAPADSKVDARVDNLRETALRMIAQLVSYPVFGPGVLDIAIHQFKIQAWQFLANDLTTPGDTGHANEQ
jgi:hypothetical protein